MEIKISAKTTVKVLYVLAWIIFFGLCIDACGFITNAIYAYYKPQMVSDFWTHNDFSSLYKHDIGHFYVQVLYMCIVAVLKALLFFMILKLLDEKNLDLSKPFNHKIKGYITLLFFITLGIGIFSNWGVSYAEWLSSQGVKLPTNEKLKLDGGSVWLFMSVTLLVISQFFKRGIEIQEENDLTV